jgi:hypothetical protein
MKRTYHLKDLGGREDNIRVDLTELGLEDVDWINMD